MEIDGIPFQKTGYFSKLISDYLDEDESLKPFYNRFPTLENFAIQLEEKSKNYNPSHRQVLADALLSQNAQITISQKTKNHLNALKEANTFTVVTGHQLNLFTGPLYFLYKIISTITFCETLQQSYPAHTFVPIYWMASEDHDFDEINFFNFKGKKQQWNRSVGGAVGRMNTQGLAEVYEVLTTQLGISNNAEELNTLFKQAYLEHENLADATRFLVNALFGEYGLVIIDGDDAQLKQLLVPFIKKDIFEQIAYKNIAKSAEKLSAISADYKIQAKPRKINYFYLGEDFRERILQKEDMLVVNNTSIAFTPEELAYKIENHPEYFSPNVIARPLYQEVILPNLCYIGGGGELAYWLELKDFFDAMGITFPMLQLRNSVLLLTRKQSKKIKKLNLRIADLFLKQHSLINKKIRQISNIDIDFSPQKKQLEEQFKHLYHIAEQTDKSFLSAVRAQEVKQKKGLDNLEKRLLKAQKMKLKDQVMRLIELQNVLFPNYSLQERQLNFSELYLEYGKDLIPDLMDVFLRINPSFLILRN